MSEPAGPGDSASRTASRSARVVLLDRDGTVVVDRDYLSDPAGLTFLPGAAEGLRQLHRRGHPLIIISNQSGVGRGLISREQLAAVNARLVAMMREIGVELAGIYCCLHRPEDRCDCRKPAIGLVRQAAEELGFEPSQAIVIGDKPSDVELGGRLGAVTIRIAMAGAAATTGGPHYVAADLLQAARIIEKL